MPLPRVVAVAPGSPAEQAGLEPGDEIVTIDGRAPRDVIEWRLLVDEPDVELAVRRHGEGTVPVILSVPKAAGQPLGAEVASALFDRVQTCDNHCEFCFIYQLPPGLRPSLYLKDDDYRLSFLYGNYTTLTRFTELDLERVVSERLSPINVSIHSTDPELRARMLRNRRGATSLRWLRALLDQGIEVHGQVVVCPGVNDGPALEATLAGILEQYAELATACVVPLGVSRHSREPSLRPHTRAEAEAVVDLVEEWQAIFRATLGRRVAFLADEYYLLADRPFPPADAYEGFPMHEDGIGMAAALALELAGEQEQPLGVQPGFFAWVDGAPAGGYRAPRTQRPVPAADPGSQPTTVLTGEYGARVLRPLLPPGVEVIAVPNRFFGGNIGVAGLLVGQDLAVTLAAQPADPGRRYLLPDVCLSNGVFLDGGRPEDLPRPVEVVATDGVALRVALGLGNGR
jgi:putative radical SAM enzyme (TIGR03279 family)